MPVKLQTRGGRQNNVARTQSLQNDFAVFLINFRRTDGLGYINGLRNHSAGSIKALADFSLQINHIGPHLGQSRIVDFGDLLNRFFCYLPDGFDNPGNLNSFDNNFFTSIFLAGLFFCHNCHNLFPGRGNEFVSPSGRSIYLYKRFPH